MNTIDSQKAAQISLDDYTPPDASEPSSSRLWRRYGSKAFDLLDQIESNPELKAELIPGSECLKVEAAHARDHEMVVHLEDFLRRRTKISMMISQKNLEENPATKESVRFFGDHSMIIGQDLLNRPRFKRCCAELTSKM